MSDNSYDVAVIGAGVFGVWTAYTLQRSGRRVLLVDAYGSGNARSSSGGETRIIRMGYGADDIYTGFAVRSLHVWKEFARESFDAIFHEIGVLHLAREDDPHATASAAALQAFAVTSEQLRRDTLRERFPQMNVGDIAWGLLEPTSGVLMARRAVGAVARAAIGKGATYRQAHVQPPADTGVFPRVLTGTGERIVADAYVFACGPWLPKMFPSVIGDRIQCTRQEVFFFGTPPGDDRFRASAMPAWVDFGAGVYGVPDIENRGFKIAFDRHGPAMDPDTTDRLVPASSVAAIREVLGTRFPALRNAPLLETRVCQYENTSTGDLLIDRHPTLSSVWLVGGGSGHGFKHGPAVGEYVAERLGGTGKPEPRLSLASKQTVRQRSVY